MEIENEEGEKVGVIVSPRQAIFEKLKKHVENNIKNTSEELEVSREMLAMCDKIIAQESDKENDG